MRKHLEPQQIDDTLALTQYGELDGDPAFRNTLRAAIGETELSLIMGAMDSDAAGMLVTKTRAEFRTCRWTSVGRLRRAGFVVEHSPTRGNSLHVSVYSPPLSSGAASEWDASVAKLFDECFAGQEPAQEGE